MKYVALALAGALTIQAAPVQAGDDKETYCGYQGAIVAAIRTARMQNVPERKVVETVLSGKVGEVIWTERYNPWVQIFTGEIYKLKKRDLRKTDLGAQWKAACLAN